MAKEILPLHQRLNNLLAIPELLTFFQNISQKLIHTIWKDIHMDESLKYPFRCVEVPPLQKIVSCRFCQTIWYEYISSENIYLNTIDNYLEREIEMRFYNFLESLKLAKPIENILKGYYWKTYRELRCCIDYFASLLRPFGRDPPQFEIDWCVWHPNGTIDYRQSAIRALNSGRLTNGYDFIIMSTFCMEEEIKTINLESLPDDLKGVDFDLFPLLFYWLCYLRNELNRVPLTLDYTLEKTMASKCYHCSEEYGLEYFWPCITDDYRILISKQLYWYRQEYSIWNNQQRLFSLISSSSTESLAIFAARYLRLSIWQSNSSLHQLRVWHRFKDQIADCDFADVMELVFEKAIDSEDAMLTLLNIWDTAKDHHREYVVQNKMDFIIDIFYDNGEYPKSPCSVAFNLLRRMLLLLPENVRSELINQHIDIFIRRLEHFEIWQKLVDLCLPNTDDRSKFKSVLSHSVGLQDMCVFFLQRGKQADLNAGLEWVFSDSGPNAVKEYKKMILTLMTWKYPACCKTFFESIPKWNELSQFIDETYAEDVQSAFEIKRMFIDQIVPITEYELSFSRDFDIKKQIIEMVLPAEDLKGFKFVRLHALCEILLNEKYWRSEREGDEVFLENFVEWCCDYDEKSIVEFKKRIPFGALLKRIVANVMFKTWWTNSNMEVELPRMDRYLKWLVGSEEKVKECKLHAIQFFNINVVKFTDRILNEVNNVQRFEMLLRWFCGGDQATMQRLSQRKF